MEKIKAAFFRELWVTESGHPGLSREQGGHQRLANNPWLYSLCIPIEAGLLTPEQAATTLQGWADKGYFTPGFGGGGYDDAVANFAKGEGLFMITGNWIVESLGADSDDFGFFVMPPVELAGAPPVSTGGAGFPPAISAGTEYPDVAAAYIDWMTSDHAADLLLPPKSYT